MSSRPYDILKTPPKALVFDVFGTVVDWRKTVTETLIASAAGKISSSSRSASLSPDVRRRLSELNDDSWAIFAQEWRTSYYLFTRGYDPANDDWRDIDTHHHISLVDLLKKWGLEGLYDVYEVEDLSKVWHYLDPWKDSSSGLQKLNTMFTTSSLSNGNQALLKDLDAHGQLGFKVLLGAEDFGAYKPHPKVYLGAARKLGLEPNEVAMVAAHLGDLKGARSCGLRTIYVERSQEETWKPDNEQYKDAQTWVDVWIKESEHGFVEVANRFGIE